MPEPHEAVITTYVGVVEGLVVRCDVPDCPLKHTVFSQWDEARDLVDRHRKETS